MVRNYCENCNKQQQTNCALERFVEQGRKEAIILLFTQPIKPLNRNKRMEQK